MKKKFAILFLIIIILMGIFIINRHNETKKIPAGQLILNEYQLEPYLNLKGWKVNEPVVETTRIPQEFNDTYKNFADEMKKSGFNLYSHKGEEVRRFTFEVENYGQEGIKAELILTLNNELISAALIQQKTDGFIKAL